MERSAGLTIDYAALRTTFAQLVERYICKECPNHKGCEVEAYTLNGFLADSRNELAEAIAAREHAIIAGLEPPSIRARRIPRPGLEWFHKPIGQVLPTDIEGYIHDRLDQDISPATIDRELDLLAQIISWAIKTLRIPLNPSPMQGVRRPRYFNERDRRLSPTEEQRLFDAAREEDHLKALHEAVEVHIAPERARAAKLPNKTARKRHIAAARRTAIELIANRTEVVQLYETLLRFLITTAARRGEALALGWHQTYLDERKVFFPDTKNGRSRDVPLRESLINLLKRLPRASDHVFPISVSALKGAWYRICDRAGISDLHIHDLRHEAISQIAEAGLESGRPFTLADLVAITGHRDPRSLTRYMKLSAARLAVVLDEVFAAARQ